MDKAHIVGEIRRAAEANGGTPLGRQRFRTETGIKDTDWLAFWPRFSDAVREAGYTPNELNQGYEAAELLECYSKLALEMGRLPAGNDLRFKASNDPDFPSHSTFDRLGKKADIVRQLLSYCQGRVGLEPVLALCRDYSRHVTADRSSEPKPDEQNDGFVYLAKSGRFYKIGKTNAVGRREYELGIQLPEKLSMVHYIRTDDPEGIEAYWHRRFSATRQNGEWFSLTLAEVAAFKRRKFM